ncbi:hypothetical protein Clacol_004013 [Clathrus columnatus]|uniref:Uncharacterized protein n=1 Tax=Clathrus columnatus TaxID=1419009 RepID=A0AAV5AAR0_9AGAM|nr:hypothetical protein Clacol_004013 [Clathrus columnatus]
MSRLISFLRWGKSREALYDFAVDGKRFVRLFGDAIALSAPHIYISALPFCPQDSIIYKTYIGQFPNTLRIVSKPICDWSLTSTGTDMVHLDRLSFSHGGEYLAVSSLEQNIFKLLDSETFDVLWTGKVPDSDINEDMNEAIIAIQFSLDDQTMVFATETKVYKVDTLTGSLMLHWDFQLTCRSWGETRSEGETEIYILHEAIFSQNARYIAFTYKSSLIVWNLETAEETINIPFDKKYSVNFNFSNSDSGYFVTYFGTIGAQVWDLETGTFLHGPFHPPQNFFVNFPRVSPNGKDIFFCDYDNHLYKWNFRDGSLMALDAGPQPSIRDIYISPNGNCIIIQSLDRITLRDINGNELHCEIDSRTFCSAFSKDEKHLASCDKGRLNIWELDGWQTTPNVQQPMLLLDRLQFQNVSLDGKYFLAKNTSTKYYEIWDVELERPVRKLNAFKRITWPIFSPRNRYLAYIPDEDRMANVLTIYDIRFGITKKFLSNGEKVYIQGFAFSQDETCIATLDLSQGRIQIWNIISSQIVDTLTIPAKPTTSSGRWWKFIASPNFQYFAYYFSDESEFSLVHRTRSIPINSLIHKQVDDHHWSRYWESFLFGLDEKYMLISYDSTMFHIDLITEEHRAVALQRNRIEYSRGRHIHFVSSSDAILVEIHSNEGYNIWNAFSGQLLYSALLEYPDIHSQFAAF